MGVGSLVQMRKQKLSKLTQLKPGAMSSTPGKAVALGSVWQTWDQCGRLGICVLLLSSEEHRDAVPGGLCRQFAKVELLIIFHELDHALKDFF